MQLPYSAEEMPMDICEPLPLNREGEGGGESLLGTGTCHAKYVYRGCIPTQCEREKNVHDTTGNTMGLVLCTVS